MTHQKAALYDVLAPAGPGDLLTARPRVAPEGDVVRRLGAGQDPRFEEQPLSLGESLAAGVVPILCWWWRRPWRVVLGLWAFVGGRQRTQEPHSNTERGRPDWRMIDIKVPERSSA